MGVDTQGWRLELNYDQWVALPVSGQRPAARYKVLFIYKLNSITYLKSRIVLSLSICFDQ